jgi:nucleotide-binding universal stress UspA family protein
MWSAEWPIIRIERILCPTDLSPESDEALRYAIALARAFNAKLFVCHCAQFATMFDERELERIVTRNITSHLSRFNAGSLDQEVVINVTDWNDPAPVIIREAAERNADLIVMQSRRRPRAAALLGSTTEAVCQAALCPVLVTHPREREFVESASEGIELNRILVADDFSGCSAQALAWGLSLAQEYQSELHLLHVLPRRKAGRPEKSRTNQAGEEIAALTISRLRNDVPEEAYLWCKVKMVVREGKPDHKILAYADELKIDLICLGSHGAGTGWRELLGTTTDRVLRRAPCPALVARNGELARAEVIPRR